MNTSKQESVFPKNGNWFGQNKFGLVTLITIIFLLICEYQLSLVAHIFLNCENIASHDVNLPFLGRSAFWFTCFGWRLTLCLILALIIWLCYRIVKTQRIQKHQWNILIRKLFQNATTAKPRALFVLAFFIIHIGLFGNILFNFLYERHADWYTLFVVILYGLAIYFAIRFYPPASDPNKAENRSLMVCGLSLRPADKKITYTNLDLIILPFLKERNKNFSTLNIKTIVIIPSKNNLEIDLKEVERAESKPLSLLAPQLQEKLTEEKNLAIKEYTEGVINTYINTIKKYQTALQTPDNSIIASVIKDFINTQGKKEWGDSFDVNVIIEPEADYDKMENCLTQIDNALKKYESIDRNGKKLYRQDTADTILYVNPGTGAFTSAMAAFAIPGERILMYWPQTRDLDKQHRETFDLSEKGYASIIAQEIKEM